MGSNRTDSNSYRIGGMIHPLFAERIASRYVTIYQREGFERAQEYLVSMVKGDEDLRNHLVPFIVDEGNRRK